MSKHRNVKIDSSTRMRTENVISALTEQDRRRAMEQALASGRIEGHVPSAAYLADCERFVRGEMTDEQMLAASLERAHATERAAQLKG
ncbi:MAG: antitoxin VbhA family protein [Burkholderiaceae bacterium]